MPKVSENHLAARRAQILDGARRCFREFGYEGATVRLLEQTTGLSRGAIFHHFRDKDALFFALAEQDGERMAQVVATEGLVQVMRNMLAKPDEYEWLGTRLEIARRIRTDPEFREGWKQRSDELNHATRARLERKKAAGTLREDVPTDVLQIYLDLVLDGLIARIASGDAGDELTAVLDIVEASVRRAT